MAENDDTLLLSFPAKIGNNGELNYDHEKLEELSAAGYNDVRIEIYGSAKMVSDLKGFDKKIFTRIKRIQSIPENVVLDFLNSKGSILNEDFSVRTLGDNK